MASCLDETGTGHAVLTVDTDQGTCVLDNRTPEILAWAEITARGYRWVNRQAVDGPGWVAVAT